MPEGAEGKAKPLHKVKFGAERNQKGGEGQDKNPQGHTGETAPKGGPEADQ